MAGATFSRNKGGMYIRSRSLVITPGTAPQANAQNAMRTLSTRWQTVLTAAQQTGWKTYAENVPLLNKLGEARPIPALSMYLRCNSPRLQAFGASAIVDAPPTTYSVGTLTTPVLTRLTTTFHVAYTNTDTWAGTTGGYLLVYLSTPQSASINFFKGPFLFASSVAGVTGTPPTSPLIITPTIPPVTGNKYFARVIASLADGRLASSQFLSVVA